MTKTDDERELSDEEQAAKDYDEEQWREVGEALRWYEREKQQRRRQRGHRK